MSQTYLDQMLSEREQIIIIARQHWFILARNILLEIVTMAAILVMMVLALTLLPGFGVIVVLVGLVIFLLPLATMIRDILNFTNRQFVITNRRVMQISGIFNKTVADSSLEKVNDIKMVQTAMGRVFDFGDIEILTASELGVNLFRQIEHPVRFKTALLNAKENLDLREDMGTTGRTGPGGKESIPALIAQLEALRQQGVLTEAEFQQKKSDLLARM